jgi:hypothetical protein
MNIPKYIANIDSFTASYKNKRFHKSRVVPIQKKNGRRKVLNVPKHAVDQ